MQAKPEIQGIHDHVEISLESQIMSPMQQKAADIEKDEADLTDVAERQTETISGSQVAFAFSQFEREEQQANKKESQAQVVVIMVAAVLVVVALYAGVVLL